LNALGLTQIKRFKSNQIQSRFKTCVSPIESSWRFMIRKRTIEAETTSINHEKLTKYVLSIKFVCDTEIVSL
jgi:hypothetical protein